MSEYQYDLFVIGAGSGGVRAARMSAAKGARVAVAEDTHLGGTCVNVGCVPKKLFVYGAHFQEVFDHAEGFGWSASKPSFNWATLRDNKTKEIERLNGIYQRMLEGAGVTIVNGFASLVGEHTVSVNGEMITAERILVATGGKPFVPEFDGAEYVLNSNDIFYLDELPRSVLVVGGGYIAVEFAGIFHGLNVDTSLIYRGEKFLRGFDDDIRDFLATQMQQKGINIQLNADISSISKLDNGDLKVTFKDGSESVVGAVMYATGRVPRFDGLGLNTLGIELDDRGYIKVNESFETNKPSVMAIGDIIGGFQLTPVALAEGMYVANHLFSEQEAKPVDYDLIPTAVFSQPNIGTVGLGEQEALARGLDIDVYVSEFRHMKMTLTNDPERVLMKLLVDKSNDHVIGAHMVGPDAGEIIQGLAIAMKAGATKADFDSTIGIHPTAAEEFVTMREPRS